MSLSLLDSLTRVSYRSVWAKQLDARQVIPFLDPEHGFSLLFHAPRHFGVTAFGHRQKTLKSLKNAAAILFSRSTSVSVSDSYTRQMRSLMSTPAAASVFDIHLKSIHRSCAEFACPSFFHKVGYNVKGLCRQQLTCHAALGSSSRGD